MYYSTLEYLKKQFVFFITYLCFLWPWRHRFRFESPKYDVHHVHAHASIEHQTLTGTSCAFIHIGHSGCTCYEQFTYGAYGKKREHGCVMRVVSRRHSCRSAHPGSNPPLWSTFVESAFSLFPVTSHHPSSCNKGERNHLESHLRRLRLALIIIILIASRMNCQLYRLALITNCQVLRW